MGKSICNGVLAQKWSQTTLAMSANEETRGQPGDVHQRDSALNRNKIGHQPTMLSWTCIHYNPTPHKRNPSTSNIKYSVWPQSQLPSHTATLIWSACPDNECHRCTQMMDAEKMCYVKWARIVFEETTIQWLHFTACIPAGPISSHLCLSGAT